MPAAYNVTAQQISTKIRLMKIEQSKYVLDQKDDDNGSIHIYPITPTNNSLFPILAGTADSYTKWKLVSLKIEYRPKVGTDAEGTVYIGHSPQFTPDTATYPSVQVISGMPKVVSTSVRQGAVLQVPLTKTEKFMRASTAQYDPFNYYEGTVVVSAYGPTTEEVGEVWAHYVVDMIQPKVNTENLTSCYGTYAGVVRSVGQLHIVGNGVNSFIYDSLLPATMILKTTTVAGVTSTVTLNGEEVAAAWTVFDSPEQVAIYRFPAMPRGGEVVVENTGTLTVQSAHMIHTSYNL